MPERFEAVYTDEQRDALATAYEDRRIRPARRVVELAQAGELAPGLAAFTVHGGDNTVRDMARKLRARRAGQHVRETSKRAPRDMLETLRVRLVAIVEEEIARVEREQKKRGAKPIDPDRLRQLARALREAAAIPTRDEPAAPKPGHGPIAQRQGGATRSSATLAGRILADASRQGETAHEPSIERRDSAETGRATAGSSGSGDSETGENEGSPGAWTREQIAALPAA